MRHAVDKVLPTLTEENIIVPPTIIFAPYAHNRHPPNCLPGTIPVAVEQSEREESSQSLAAATGVKLKISRLRKMFPRAESGGNERSHLQRLSKAHG